MSSTRRPSLTPARPGGGAITLRLDPTDYGRLARLARAENRNPTNYVETLVLRDLAAKEEAARILTMLAPADAQAATPGALQRTEGDSDARHAERVEVFDRLFALPDAE